LPADIAITPFPGLLIVDFFIAIYAPRVLKDEVSCKHSNFKYNLQLSLFPSFEACIVGVFLMLPFRISGGL